MRILVLYPYGRPDTTHGSLLMGVGVIKELLSRGHDVYVAPRTRAEEEAAQALGLHVLLIPPVPRRVRFGRRFLPTLVPASQIRPLMASITEHRIEVILERHTLANIGFAVAKRLDLPYITNDVLVFPDIEFYGTISHRTLAQIGGDSLFRFLERKPFVYADSIISHSEAYSTALVEDMGVSRQKIFQFYAMVDKQFFTPGDREAACRRIGLNVNEFHVIYVSGLDRLHSSQLLLPVIERCSGLGPKFVIVGDGPLMQGMKEAVSKMRADVVFTGTIGRQRVLDYILASDVGVECIWNPRVCRYGADSMKIYEYMACAKAVIASDLPGQIQRLRENGAALLVDPSDAEVFAAAIMRLFHDRALGIELGKNGRRMVEEEWSWDHTGDVIDAALRSAVDRHRDQN